MPGDVKNNTRKSEQEGCRSLIRKRKVVDEIGRFARQCTERDDDKYVDKRKKMKAPYFINQRWKKTRAESNMQKR